MSIQDNVTIQVLKSADVLSGGTSDISVHFADGSYPKLPESDSLEYGEIALNIAKGYEVIAIKNYDNEIVYLPFNVAARLLVAETSLDELSSYTISSVSELSGSTVSLFEDVESFKREITGVIEVSVSSLSGEVYTAMGQLSTETNERIDSLSSVTDSKIAMIVEYLVNISQSVIPGLSGQISDVSGNTLSLISSLSSTTLSTFGELEQSIHDTDSKVDSLSAETKSDIEALSDTVYGLSGETSAGFDSVRNELGSLIAETDERLSGSITSLSGQVESSAEEICEKIDILSASTDNKINETVDGVIYIVSEAYSSLSGKIDLVSGETESKIGELGQSIHDTDSKVDSLSAETDSKISSLSSDIGGKVDGLSAYTVSSISELNGDIADIEGDILSVSGSVDDLSSFVTDSLSALTEELKSEISNAKDLSVEEAKQYTDEQITFLSGETIDYVESVISDTIESIEDEISSVSALTKSEAVLESMDYADEKIEAFSGISLSYIDGKAEEAKEQAIEVSELMIAVSGQTIEESAVSRSAEYTDIIASGISESLYSLSGETLDAISGIEEDIDDRFENLKLGDLNDVEITENSVGNGLQFLTKSDDTWTNRFIGSASEEDYGFVKIGNGIDVNDGVISAQKIDVDDSIVSGSTNPVSGGAVYPLTEQITTLSGSSDEIRDELRSHVADFNEFSASTDGHIAELSDSIETCNDDLLEVELVHAGAFGRINNSLGFNVNAEYNPSHTELSGMNVTEAIDYLFNWAGDIDFYLGTEDTRQLIRSVTYESLVQLKQQRKLRWGLIYRITNYQATINSEASTIARVRGGNVPSGPHTSMGFDILVRATSDHTLDENAILSMSEGKYYFEDCSLESWNVKYSLDNDKSRFNWADENGYGVIYYMKDNYDNEAPYDFKNIYYKAGRYNFFTFSNSTDDTDLSLVGLARCNTIKPAYLEGQLNKAVMVLNRNVFRGSEIVGNTTDAGVTHASMYGDFHGCRISTRVSHTAVEGPMENMLIGYDNIDSIQN